MLNLVGANRVGTEMKAIKGTAVACEPVQLHDRVANLLRRRQKAGQVRGGRRQ